jgi:hypothetical protein
MPTGNGDAGRSRFAEELSLLCGIKTAEDDGVWLQCDGLAERLKS